jgi:hypothetical protein
MQWKGPSIEYDILGISSGFLTCYLLESINTFLTPPLFFTADVFHGWPQILVTSWKIKTKKNRELSFLLYSRKLFLSFPFGIAKCSIEISETEFDLHWKYKNWRNIWHLQKYTYSPTYSNFVSVKKLLYAL